MADWLLVRPTKSLAQDTQDFETKILTRLIGFSNVYNTVDTLQNRGVNHLNQTQLEKKLAQGTGVVGHLMYKITALLVWFEERFILRGSGEGMQSMLASLGAYLTQIDSLLSQPRYLLVLIMATFAVII